MNNDAQSPSTYYRRASAKRLILCAVLLSKLLYSTLAVAQILGTGHLNVERRSHTATLLENGKVLIVGGEPARRLQWAVAASTAESRVPQSS